MKLHLPLRLIAALLIMAGLAGLIPIGYFGLKSKVAVAQPTSQAAVQAAPLAPSPSLVTGQPVEISIPSLRIDLPIIPGYYNTKTGEWTLTLDKAQFAEPSVQPNNESGNTLIYGHYRPEVFAYLHLIKPGAQVQVKTANGYTFSYTYVNSVPLDPTDTSIFAYRGAPRLTIQTCSGSFMQHRQMYYFAYDGYVKST
jgi:LPXTG-site transpeptidase (sortase) family protein